MQHVGLDFYLSPWIYALRWSVLASDELRQPARHVSWGLRPEHARESQLHTWRQGFVEIAIARQRRRVLAV